jgi:hypothetical protein
MNGLDHSWEMFDGDEHVVLEWLFQWIQSLTVDTRDSRVLIPTQHLTFIPKYFVSQNIRSNGRDWDNKEHQAIDIGW